MLYFHNRCTWSIFSTGGICLAVETVLALIQYHWSLVLFPIIAGKCDKSQSNS